MAPRFSLPNDWSEILDRIQRALAHADRLAQEREDAQTACLAIEDKAKARTEMLDQLPERVVELNHRLKSVAGDMAGVDSALADAEARFQSFLGNVSAVSGRLGQWLGCQRVPSA